MKESILAQVPDLVEFFAILSETFPVLAWWNDRLPALLLCLKDDLVCVIP